MNPNTCTALCTSDLSGNKDGWSEQLVRRPDSLNPYLYPSQAQVRFCSDTSAQPAAVQPPPPTCPLGPSSWLGNDWAVTVAPEDPPTRGSLPQAHNFSKTQ